jgi:hypothetical protein
VKKLNSTGMPSQSSDDFVTSSIILFFIFTILVALVLVIMVSTLK